MAEHTQALVEASSKLVLAEHVDPRGMRLHAFHVSQGVLVSNHCNRPCLKCADDMVAERARASFGSRHLAEFLNGGKKVLERRHAVLYSACLRLRLFLVCASGEMRVTLLFFSGRVCWHSCRIPHGATSPNASSTAGSKNMWKA